MRFTIEPDKRKTEAVEQVLSDIPGAFDRVTVRTINDTAKKGQSVITKRIAKVITLKQKDIRKDVHVRRVSNPRQVGHIKIRGQRFNILKFQGTPKTPEDQRKRLAKRTKKGKIRKSARGVKYRIMRGGPKQRVDEAFVQKMPSGFVGAFKRKGTDRLPIDALEGPSIQQVFGDDTQALQNEALTEIDGFFEKRYDQLVELELERAFKKGGR